MSSDGNPIDFEEFYRLHQASLIRIAQRMARNQSDAEDLVQETFERAFGAFSRFAPGTNGTAWLRTIMSRLFIDKCRRSRGMRRTDGELARLAVAAPEPEPEAWWLSLTVDDVKEAVATLPEESRPVFESFALQGSSYKEIAKRTGLCSSTVGTRLHRMRAQVRSRLMRHRPAGTGAMECSGSEAPVPTSGSGRKPPRTRTPGAGRRPARSCVGSPRPSTDRASS
jgi:RNA polymerase sigma-70 factor (ECF subfamily)